MGYAGGHKHNPTYHDLGDHAEALDVRFDPQRVTYDDLLDRFWAAHDPTRPGRSTQYRAALFVYGPEQQAAAEASRDREAARLGERIATEIIVDAPFYPAEGYHQKWRLRRHQAIFDDLQDCFATEAELLASAAATKLNGLVGGSKAEIARWSELLGLTEGGLAELTASARGA